LFGGRGLSEEPEDPDLGLVSDLRDSRVGDRRRYGRGLLYALGLLGNSGPRIGISVFEAWSEIWVVQVVGGPVEVHITDVLIGNLLISREAELFINPSSSVNGGSRRGSGNIWGSRSGKK